MWYLIVSIPDLCSLITLTYLQPSISNSYADVTLLTIILSEAMSQGIASPGTPTDPARAKELLEELYQLYNID